MRFAFTSTIFCILVLLTTAVVGATQSAITLAVISEDPNQSTEPGSMEQVESAVEEGLMKKKGVSVITRRHLEKILSEQGLAYQNIVNDRARLGNLCGATVLFIVSVDKNEVSKYSQDVSAYGMTERQIHYSSAARISVSAVDVSTGKILLKRAYSKRSDSNSSALESCVVDVKSDMSNISIQDIASNDQAERHKLVIKPMRNGQEVFGLDLLVDGNFVGNTPFTTDAEDGIHAISIQKGSQVLWNNRVQVHRDVWLNPELSN